MIIILHYSGERRGVSEPDGSGSCVVSPASTVRSSQSLIRVLVLLTAPDSTGGEPAQPLNQPSIRSVAPSLSFLVIHFFFDNIYISISKYISYLKNNRYILYS